MLIRFLASTVASNSRVPVPVPVPDMAMELQEALDTDDTRVIHAAIRKVSLVGQNCNEVLREMFERACTLRDTQALERILDLDNESIPSILPIHVNGIWPKAVEPSLVDDCTRVLRCFLKNGLDPHQMFAEQAMY